MPKITDVLDYDGFSTRVQRLGLSGELREAENAITRFDLLVEEQKHANGTKGLREIIDSGFESAGGWSKITVGGIDWKKSNSQGGAIGVEVQVSGRSDLLAVDVLHFNHAITAGEVDAGVIIVPDDVLSRFLTDRTPNFRTAKKHVDLHASNLPIRIVAFRHDGIGTALPKMVTNLGRK